ncbi:7744_t:CDS:1, partial [Racocetra fulgida]
MLSLQKAVYNNFVSFATSDEDLRLKEAKKAVTRSFEDPADQETFDRMQIVFLQC